MNIEEDNEELSSDTIMAERLTRELEAALVGDDHQLLTRLAHIHERARTLESQMKSVKEQAAKRIMEIMDRMGVDSMKLAGRRLGFREQEYFGIDRSVEGSVSDMKAWIEAIAPEVNIPASTNIGKAVTAYLDMNPGAMLPPFIKVTKSRGLVNAKA